MKQLKLFILSLCLLNSAYVGAQKYGNIWHFGRNAGIDFNSCEAVVLTNGRSSGFEGCATISDANGQLLFYTTSDSVWDRQHNPMPNGQLIYSSGTLSQVIIIPRPQTPGKYYIITTRVQAQGFLTFRYHEIDMALNNGLGDVLSKNNEISPLNITEQVAATYHANGTDIWLMTHEYGTNKFLAYLVTAAGISLTPIVSSTGPVHVPCTSNMNARGHIKFSPDGKRLAYCGNGVGPDFSSNLLAVFRFDNSTGIVYEPINLPYCGGEFGLSFSPDNTKLYGSTWRVFNFAQGARSYVYQFDLSDPDSLAIASSRVIIDSSHTEMTSDIKLAPDGRIYIVKYSKPYLDVISDPNQPGLACGYLKDGFHLGGAFGQYGLNNYIEYTSYCSDEDFGLEPGPGTTLQILPNPSHDYILVRREHPFENAVLVLYDLRGVECIRMKVPDGNTCQVSLTGIKPGMYVMRVTEKEGMSGQSKIIIE